MSTRDAAGPQPGLPPSCAIPAAPCNHRAGARAPAGRDHVQIAHAAHPPLPAESNQAWSDDAVQQLHEGVLRHALQSLHARGNAELKREILHWIFCPSAMVLTRPDAQGRPRATVLPQECTPFSFEQCCRICGYDPQRLRDGLASLLQAIGLATTLAEITRDASQTTKETGTRTAAQGARP